MFNLTRNKY